MTRESDITVAKETSHDQGKTMLNLLDVFANGKEPGEGNIADFGLVGAAGGFVGGLATLSPSRAFEGSIEGLIAGFATAGIDRGLDMAVGDRLGGHRLFRPTGVESLVIGVAEGLPIKDVRVRLALAATGWILGRVDNYFTKTN
jgi:hypothetical protein